MTSDNDNIDNVDDDNNNNENNEDENNDDDNNNENNDNNDDVNTNDDDDDDDDDYYDPLRGLPEEIRDLFEERPSDEAPFWTERKLEAAQIEERELLLEKLRVAEVKQAYEEQRRHTYRAEEEECPICLETMQGEEIDLVPHCTCCVKCICSKCHSLNKLDKCPLCRAKFLIAEEYIIALQKLAQNGNAWAQCNLGDRYACGTNGVEVNDELAFKWYHRAAVQGFSLAMLRISYWHLNLDNVPGRTDYVEARRWYQATIDKGHQSHAIFAMEKLGQLNFKGLGGPKDPKEAFRLFTLKVAYSPEPWLASFYLGGYFRQIYGELEKSLYRAKYYLRLATKYERFSNSGLAQYLLGQTLHDLAKERGWIDQPGHSNLPEVLYWLRKAVSMGYDGAAALVEAVEQEMKRSCANCMRYTDRCAEKPKCCPHCRAIWYCGNDCQNTFWERGHKFDCYNPE